MKKIYIAILFIILLHVIILVNLQYTLWPEMMSFPYMVNKGFVIYKDFHHAYQPLLTFILAFFYKIFGYKLIVTQIFTWAIIVISDLLIYLISKKLTNEKIALISLVIFACLQPYLEGNMLWFDIVTIPFILLSIYFLFNKKLFLSGFALCLAMLIKQQAVLLLIGFFVYFFLKKISVKDLFKFALGGIIPVFISTLIIITSGIFNNYIFWTFSLPLKYLPKIPGYSIWPAANQILLLIVLSLPFSLLITKIKKAEVLLLIISFIALFVAALPRFSFFHLQPMLAVYALLIGLAIYQSKKIIWLTIPLTIFVILFIKNISLFGKEARFYDQNSIDLANIIKKDVRENETMYLIGPNGLIYVLSNRIPPKPWIENYVWHFEIPGIQEEIIQNWKLNSPNVIFWSDPTPGNWYDIGTYQPKNITNYIEKNYTKVKEVQKGVWEWRIKNQK